MTASLLQCELERRFHASVRKQVQFPRGLPEGPQQQSASAAGAALQAASQAASPGGLPVLRGHRPGEALSSGDLGSLPELLQMRGSAGLDAATALHPGEDAGQVAGDGGGKAERNRRPLFTSGWQSSGGARAGGDVRPSARGPPALLPADAVTHLGHLRGAGAERSCGARQGGCGT